MQYQLNRVNLLAGECGRENHINFSFFNLSFFVELMPYLVYIE